MQRIFHVLMCHRLEEAMCFHTHTHTPGGANERCVVTLRHAEWRCYRSGCNRSRHTVQKVKEQNRQRKLDFIFSLFVFTGSRGRELGLTGSAAPTLRLVFWFVNHDRLNRKTLVFTGATRRSDQNYPEIWRYLHLTIKELSPFEADLQPIKQYL